MAKKPKFFTCTGCYGIFVAGTGIMAPKNKLSLKNVCKKCFKQHFKSVPMPGGAPDFLKNAYGAFLTHSGGLISNTAGGVVSTGGSGIISDKSGGLLGKNLNKLVGHDGSSLIGQDGASFRGR